MERRDMVQAKKEFTTQKIRQEWAEHEEQFVGTDGDDWPSTTCTTVAESVDSNATFKPIDSVTDELESATITPPSQPTSTDTQLTDATAAIAGKDDSKSKKKRRKKSMMKKKATQRKSSSSSSIGSAHSDQNDPETDTISLSATTNETRSSSNEDSPKSELQPSAIGGQPKETTTIVAAAANAESHSRIHPLDIHFFSDTELTSTKSPSRPSTPIQSDSEIEISHRDSNVMTSSASWKWGELPTQGVDSQEATTEDAKQAQRNSMLSNMFSFMKQTKKLRKTSNAEGVYLSELDMAGMDPEVAALYFPPINKKDTGLNVGSTAAQMMAAGNNTEDDRESGNGTSLPHSPSSMEGLKSLDSDYDDNGKSIENK